MKTVMPDNIPKPTRNAVLVFVRQFANEGEIIPAWALKAIEVAYQNGRYDEACVETFAGALE